MLKRFTWAVRRSRVRWSNLGFRNSRAFLGAVLATALLASVTAHAALAQDDALPAPSLGNLRFSFAPPGARSLGMGSTFVAIADDATAAEANPAGLIILERPEISGHFRSSSIETETIDFNAALFDEQIRTGTFDSTVSGLSFASFVYPLENVAFAGYYQRQSNFETASEFVDDRLAPLFVSTASTSFDLLIENFGASMAVALGRWISVGGSVRYTRLDLNIREFFGARNNVTGAEQSLEDRFSGEDENVTFNVGFLANPNGTVSAGFVYKRGDDFSIDNAFRTREFDPGRGDQEPRQTELVFDSVFTVPSVWAVGVAFRPPDRSWMVSADVTRVNYSELTTSGSFLEFAGAAAGIPITEPIDDEFELHVGGEYTFVGGATPIAIRAGAFTDPDHDGLAFVDSGRLNFTLGAGFVLGQRLQIDGAVNLAEGTQEGLLSLVFRL